MPLTSAHRMFRGLLMSSHSVVCFIFIVPCVAQGLIYCVLLNPVLRAKSIKKALAWWPCVLKDQTPQPPAAWCWEGEFMAQVCCCSCGRAGPALQPGSTVPFPATPGSGDSREHIPFCGCNLQPPKIQIIFSFPCRVKRESRICDSCILFSAVPLRCWKSPGKVFHPSCDPIFLPIERE